ncbi:MAG: hypothetical protein COV67_10525 [Nitrospinae bacterium CG11_big_fil_rev_8_21_14_0_20_56_8]|nr:MAG: hypothetical protein COV67_10525 [Nitrospinae bacterium CG11_big_fil_rev_8_21_14_0_20_56_8]
MSTDNTTTQENKMTDTPTPTTPRRQPPPRSGFHLLLRRSDELSGTQAVAKSGLSAVVQVFDGFVRRGHNDSIAATAVQLLIVAGQRKRAEQLLGNYLAAKAEADAANERKPAEKKLTMDQVNLVRTAAQRVGLTAFEPQWGQRGQSFFIPDPAFEAKRILKSIRDSNDPMTKAIFPVIGRLFLEAGLVQAKKKDDAAEESTADAAAS